MSCVDLHRVGSSSVQSSGRLDVISIVSLCVISDDVYVYCYIGLTHVRSNRVVSEQIKRNRIRSIRVRLNDVITCIENLFILNICPL